MEWSSDLVARYGSGELWVGSAPPDGLYLGRLGFTAVAFCAGEYQPKHESYPNLTVIYAPLDDAGLPPADYELEVALGASKYVARLLRSGNKVLVSCWEGKNRSGLVAALALMRLTGARGRDAANRVAAARRGALGNPYFLAFLQEKATRKAVMHKV